MTRFSALNVANGRATVGTFAYPSPVFSLASHMMFSGLTTRNAECDLNRHRTRAIGSTHILRARKQSAVFCADTQSTLVCGEEQ